MRSAVILSLCGVVLALVISVCASPVFAQAAGLQAPAVQTPPPAFVSPAQRQASPSPFAGPAPRAAPLQATGPFGRLMTWVTQTQQKMQRELASMVKALKSGNGVRAGLLLIWGSFIYGIVHAAGPGHGKAIISSYVVANEETVRRGILISFLAAAVQGLMAVLLVGILIIVLKGSGLSANAWVMELETASYALVFLVGLYLLVTSVSRLWRRRAQAPADNAHDHGHSHSHRDHAQDAHHRHMHEGQDHYDHSQHRNDHHHHDPENCEACGHIVDVRDIAGPMSWKEILAVVFAVGIRPCSGAVLVLIFTLAQGLLWAGVVSTFAMALGTAITVSVLATLALGSRQLALSLGGGNARWIEGVWTICAIGGALLVMSIGLLLFLASLGPARPF